MSRQITLGKIEVIQEKEPSAGLAMSRSSNQIVLPPVAAGLSNARQQSSTSGSDNIDKIKRLIRERIIKN